MLPTLYEIAGEYRQQAALLAELDLDEQTVADTLESLTGDFDAKAMNVAALIRNLDGLAGQIKQAEAQMNARRKAVEARANHIRNYLLTNMQACSITKIESPLFQIAIKQNPAKVVIDDAGAIPSDLYRYPEAPPPEPDLVAIKAALKAGEDVRGAHLEHGVRLDIK